MLVLVTPVSPPEYRLSESFSNYEREFFNYIIEVKNKLYNLGYIGHNTGRICRFPVGDGYALYMAAETQNNKMCVIDLEWLDAYQFSLVNTLTRKQVIRACEEYEYLTQDS